MRLIAFLIFSLCLFDSALASEVIADFGPEFFFGLASAPGHAEDKLEDGWQRFANEGKVAAYNNVIIQKKIMVLDGASGGAILGEKAGIGVYRMGVDWGRLTPNDPFNLEYEKKSCPIGVQNFDALQRYREILKDIKNRKMKVMLTLFHHSLPVWAIDKGGWANQEVREHFIAFSKDVYDELGDLVDQWVIFNEPALFNSLSYVGVYGLTPKKV